MLSIILDLELEGLPPTVNNMYRSTRGGQRYKTKDCRYWQEDTVRLMKQHYTGQPNTSRLELVIEFKVKDKRRWDIDNRVKALQDCLISANILKDDSQIDSLHVTRSLSNTAGTHLCLSEYTAKST